jgi:hypothetical protein
MDELLAFPFLQSLKDKDVPAKKAQDGPPKATGGNIINEDQEYHLTLRSLDSGEELHEDEVDQLNKL